MKKNIILPLADGENQRVPNFDNVKYFKVHTSDIKDQHSSFWYSEVGKMIHWAKLFDFQSRHGGYSATGLMKRNK